MIRIRRSGAGTALVVASLATASLALSGTPAAAAGRADTRAADTRTADIRAEADGTQAFSPVIAAMQRDLGLTRAQVLARLTNETRARQLQPRLQAQLGDRYAGAWVTSDGVLVVATTDATTTGTITAAGARAAVVGRTLGALSSAKRALDAAARTVAHDAVPVWFVDERTNTVVVQALDAGAGAAFVRASGLDPATVRIEAISERPTTFAIYNLRGADAYYIGSARCSVGFPVTQGATRGFVSAGHCGNAGNATAGYNGQSQGTFQASSFPTNDESWVAVNSFWSAPPAVNGYGAGQFPVFGSAEAPVGAAVCRSGSTTAWHCGTILQRNTSVTYAQGTVFEVVRTNVCAEPGDSGGPYISGFQAQGVTSGGNGNCTSGGTTFFQPVNEILTTYGLALSTTGGQCGNQPNLAFNEQTWHQGSFGQTIPDVVNYPANGYTSGTAGVHSACLEGADTGNVTATLQRYTCCGPFGIPQWINVATTGVGGPVKTLSTSQPAGTYRWSVTTTNPSIGPNTAIGAYYLLGYNRPA
jgi:streptogrisin C